jgi:phosphoglycolate phosphatase-like HAD superfamily hydrolase
MIKKKFKPDALIFDVDGVLLDVEKSFPEVIKRTILTGWESICGGISDSEGYTAEHERVLKLHGAFNDDYDIAWALLSMAAASGSRKLSEAFPAPELLAREIEGLSGDIRRQISERYSVSVPRLKLRALSLSLYTGGLYREETPLVKRHWRDIPLPAAVYTGRDKLEWSLAKESLGWQDFPDELVIEAESGIAKPSPRGLEILAGKLGSKRPAYFGDTASDLQAQEAFGRGYFVGVGRLMKDCEFHCETPEAVFEELERDK